MVLESVEKLTVERVNTLAGQKPQYRLGDAVMLRHTESGMWAFKQVVNSPQHFSSTVLYDYGTKINRDDVTPQWPVLREAVLTYSRRPDLPVPLDDELVVHLRMGDTKGYKGTAEQFANYISGLIRRAEGIFTQVAIVTAIHFGELLLRNRLSPQEVSIASQDETEKILEIVDLIASSGMMVKLRSHQEIDKDFCYVANARHLVLGNGLFSLCAAMVSDARCYIPPWTMTGSITGNEVLQYLRREREA